MIETPGGKNQTKFLKITLTHPSSTPPTRNEKKCTVINFSLWLNVDERKLLIKRKEREDRDKDYKREN